MRTLISLTSDQTLPNILFIKQFGPFDKYVFLTTATMEKKGVLDWIEKTCKLSQVERILIPAEHIEAIRKVLQKFEFDDDEELTVHITGGTKMMALACFNFFSGLYAPVHIFYKPIQEDTFLKIFPNTEVIPLKAKVNLLEYLSAYGVKIIENSKVDKNKASISTADEIMNKLKKGNIALEVSQAISKNYRGKDKVFLTGGWFELWVAHYIKSFFELKENEIRLNLKLTRANNNKSIENTEYDIMYVRNNRLYIGECKYFPNGKFAKKKINKEWYKLAGLQLHMGLSANAFLITANPFPAPLEQYLLESHKLFRIKGYADIKIIKNKNKFNRFLNHL